MGNAVPARRLNAQKLAGDIRSGSSYGRLMERYSLSEASLESLFRKMVKSGLVASEELPVKDHVPEDFDSRFEDIRLAEDPALSGLQHHAEAQSRTNSPRRIAGPRC